MHVACVESLFQFEVLVEIVTGVTFHLKENTLRGTLVLVTRDDALLLEGLQGTPCSPVSSELGATP